MSKILRAAAAFPLSTAKLYNSDMKIAYLDCYSGISGDMCLGALVDAGVPLKDMERALKKLNIKGYRLTEKKVARCGIAATKVDVLLTGNNKTGAVSWKDIASVIKSSTLDNDIKKSGLAVFRSIFEAEAKVHGEPFDHVHLHELGGIDCLVDVFGTLCGLALLGIDKVYASPVNLGSGTIRTAHGILPVPAPATAELLRGHLVYKSDVPFEMTTPTGAALIAGLSVVTSPLPSLRIEKIGYGAGGRDIPSVSNTLRILIGEDRAGLVKGKTADETITVIEANIDDMNPQFYEEVMNKLFNAGALDVSLENIIMKKGRPAIKLSVLSREEDAEKLTGIIFSETTTIGVRFYPAGRRVLQRNMRTLVTPFGKLRIKIALLDDSVVNVCPEYDDLKLLAEKNGLSLKNIAKEIAPFLKHAAGRRKNP